ncbi:MAG: hypothetical protein KDD44_12445, partial [Bdellovibrionales bacterium]|nr:hypothetical protein [Bdellovibrionales bacterium]
MRFFIVGNNQLSSIFLIAALLRRLGMDTPFAIANQGRPWEGLLPSKHVDTLIVVNRGSDAIDAGETVLLEAMSTNRADIQRLGPNRRVQDLHQDRLLELARSCQLEAEQLHSEMRQLL